MKKIILITGATGSIGKATALELANRNCNLILVGRNETKLRHLKMLIMNRHPEVAVVTELVDLSEPESVSALTSRIIRNNLYLSGLINAAAIYETERKINSRGIELMFATNHLGPFQLTLDLLDLLKAAPSARIMNITAPSNNRLNFEDLLFEKKFSPIKAYEATKTANLLFTYKLAQLLSWTYVSAFAFHPGVVKSDLLKDMPPLWKFLLRNVAKEPATVSKVIAHFMLHSFEDTLNAKLLKFDGTRHKPSPYFQSLQNLNQLWDISNDLLTAKNNMVF